jgi:hypothetical protein
MGCMLLYLLIGGFGSSWLLIPLLVLAWVVSISAHTLQYMTERERQIQVQEALLRCIDSA